MCGSSSCPWVRKGGGHSWVPHPWMEKEVVNPFPVKEPWQDAKATIHRRSGTPNKQSWKHPVGPDKLCHDVTVHISCPSILTLNHTFHLPFSIFFFWMPSFRKFLVYSAVLPPKPLIWTILGWWPDLGQRAPWWSPGSCLYMSYCHVGLGKARHGAQHGGPGVWLSGLGFPPV